MSQNNMISNGVGQVASEYAECPICLVAIAEEGQAAILAGPHNERICEHFYCERCARLLNPKNCAMCRRVFDRVEVVNTSNPDRVFDLIDLDRNGWLDRREVEKAILMIKLTLPKDTGRYVAENWSKWDTDGNGWLSRDEFVEVCQVALRDIPIGSIRQAPKFSGNARVFFEYWDTDKSGSLSHDELLLAFVHAFGFTGFDTTQAHKVRSLADSLQAVMLVFDDDGSQNMEWTEFQEFHANYKNFVPV